MRRVQRHAPWCPFDFDEHHTSVERQIVCDSSRRWPGSIFGAIGCGPEAKINLPDVVATQVPQMHDVWASTLQLLPRLFMPIFIQVLAGFFFVSIECPWKTLDTTNPFTASRGTVSQLCVAQVDGRQEVHDVLRKGDHARSAVRHAHPRPDHHNSGSSAGGKERVRQCARGSC